MLLARCVTILRAVADDCNACEKLHYAQFACIKNP